MNLIRSLCLFVRCLLLELMLGLTLCIGGIGAATANTFDAATLTGLTLNCPASLPSGVPRTASSFACTQTARYSDGTTKLVRQHSEWSSDNSAVLSVDSVLSLIMLSGGFVETGVLGSGVVTADTPVAITASYSEGGATVTGTANVTVRAQKLSSLGISCPATIYAGVPVTCTTTAGYSDGTSKVVAVDWQSSNSSVASISNNCSSTGNFCSTLVPGRVSSNTVVSLTASYTDNGITKTTTTNITVKPPPTLTNLVVTCPAAVTANSGSSNIGSCVLIEFYSGSSVNASQAASWTSSQPGVLTVSNPAATASGTLAGGGKLATLATASDTVVTVSASVVWYGTTKTASTTLTVKGVVPVLTGLTASCPASVNAGASTTCLATASYNDNSSKSVTATWVTGSTVASMSGSTLTAGQVLADTPATITATYTEKGVTQTTTTKITIKPVAVNACLPSLSANNTSVPAAGGSYAFTVSAGSACTWPVSTLSTWLHPATGSGTGNASLGFTVDANNSTAVRTGTISVGNQTYTVTQAGGKAAPITAASADCVFNWAEKHYSEQFPGPAESASIGNDYFRFYSRSNSSLGTTGFEQLKYVGPLSNGDVLILGDMAAWVTVAGCQ